MDLHAALAALGATDPTTRGPALAAIAHHVLEVTGPALARSTWGAEVADEAVERVLLRLCQRDRAIEAEHPAAYLRRVVRNECVRVYQSTRARRHLDVPLVDEQGERVHEASTHAEEAAAGLALDGQTLLPGDALGREPDEVVRLVSQAMATHAAPLVSNRKDAVASTRDAIVDCTRMFLGEVTMDDLVADAAGEGASLAAQEQARDRLNRRNSRARDRLLRALEALGDDEGDLGADANMLLMREFVDRVMSRA
jgi:hypothetical protein